MLLETPQTDGVVRTPDISGTRDLYISPMDLRGSDDGHEHAVWFEKGQEVEQGGVTYVFNGFHMEQGERLRVTADVTVRAGELTHQVVPAVEVGMQEQTPLDAEIDGVGRIGLRGVDADGGRVALALPSGGAPVSMATLEVSTKPWINLVWVGALLALIGTAIAGMRRAAETLPAPARRRSRPAHGPAAATMHASPRR